MKREEREQLFDDLLEGIISEADFLRLEAEMHLSEEVRQAYYDRVKLHTGLALEAENAAAIHGKTVTTVGRKASSMRFGWLGIAGAILLAVFSGALGWRIGKDADAVPGQSGKKASREEPSAVGFGVLVDQIDADWAEGQTILERGDLIASGPRRLLSGAIKVELFSGVEFLLQGPSHFDVQSASEVFVEKGTMQAIIPEVASKEFRIVTKTGELTYPGEAVSIEVSEDGSVAIHTVRGAANWMPVDAGWKRIPENTFTSFPIDPQKVSEHSEHGEGETGPVELNFSFADHLKEKQDRWLREVDRIRNDPRVIFYFPMNQEAALTERVLRDESSSRNHGTIVRANWVQDRWGRSRRALDFSPAGSRVRLNIQGEFRSLTLLCWVRIDSLDRWYNSLFLTDGHELHEPHWQIMDDGRLFFSVKAIEKPEKTRDKHIAFSPPIWEAADSGRWAHIATVYDGEAATSTHYLNGELISQDEIPPVYQIDKVRIGVAQIGNWSNPPLRNDPHFAVRNLNGAIDEFAMFAAPLSAEEIRHHYETGNP